MEQNTNTHSKKLKNDPRKQMNRPGETYEDMVARLAKIVEQDGGELSDETIKNIEESITDIKAGRMYTSDQVKRKLGLK